MSADDVGGCCPFFRRRRNKGPINLRQPLAPARGPSEAKTHPQKTPGLSDGDGPHKVAVGQKSPDGPLRSPGSVPASVIVGSIDSHGGFGRWQPDLGAAYGTSLRRVRAERNFRGAAAKLERILRRDPSTFSVPDGIGLQHVDRVDDVEEEAKKIEFAIEDLVRQQAVLRESERIIKIWVRDWFRASFPFVKATLKTIGVYTLLKNAQLTCFVGSRSKSIRTRDKRVPFLLAGNFPIASFVAYFVEAAYNAGQTAVEINGTLLFLSDAIHRVQVTKGFSDVLNDKQLDDVNCAALNLSAVVTEYLTMATEYFMENSIG